MALGTVAAQASTRTRLARETTESLDVTQEGRGELQNLLADDDAARLSPTHRQNRSPAVLDLPTDRPSGENANAVLENEHRVAQEVYPAKEPQR